MNALRPYQIDGAAWLAARPRALLADEMGLGKTAQAVFACRALGEPTVVVVCPASVCETWRREFRKWWWPGASLNFLRVTSYDRMRRGDLDLVEHIDELILDEAHFLGSATSKQTRHVFGDACDGVGGLIARAERVMCLTGTPMKNHAAELWPMLRALAPELILSTSGKPYSYWQFVKKFCKTRDTGFGDPQIVGAKNHEKLRAALAPFMLRRLKSEVATDLPAIAFEPLYVEGTLAHTDETRAQAWAAAEVVDREGAAGLPAVAPALATLRRLTGMAKVPACIEWIGNFLESGRKLVVFAYHRDVIEHLLAALGAKVAVVRGETLNRTEAVDRFQNDPSCRVFLGQIQAAGTGITLTAASDVLFVESDWTPANISQAAMRVHRIGQTEPCLVRFATLAGSVDEDIERALVRKVSDIERIVG